jgi:hypothetical protein
VRNTLDGRVIWALQVTASPPADVANGLRAKLTGHSPVKTSLGGMSADGEALVCGREAWIDGLLATWLSGYVWRCRGSREAAGRLSYVSERQPRSVPQHSGTAKATTSRECM